MKYINVLENLTPPQKLFVYASGITLFYFWCSFSFGEEEATQATIGMAILTIGLDVGFKVARHWKAKK